MLRQTIMLPAILQQSTISDAVHIV